MREFILCQVCLEEQDGVIYHVYLQEININEGRKNEVPDQDEPSRRDHMLESYHTYGDH
jgi:hypothetical protein